MKSIERLISIVPILLCVSLWLSMSSCKGETNNHITVMKAGSGTGNNTNSVSSTPSSFDQFIYNAQPDGSGMYNYLASDQPLDLAPATANSATTTTNARYYDAKVILQLKSDHTFSLFYNEYLAQKDTHGNYCTQIQGGSATPVLPYIFGVEKQGQWQVSAGRLTLSGIGAGVLATTKAGVTLSFSGNINKTGLQGKSHLITPQKYDLSYDNLHSSVGTDTVTEAAANSTLDTDCTTTVPVNFSNSEAPVITGQPKK